MNFEEFAKTIAAPGLFTENELTDDNSVVSDDRIWKVVETISTYLEHKISRLNKLNLDFIREEFRDMWKVESYLITNYNGEVPVSVAKALSEALYKKQLIALNETETAVIKVLTVYCIIL